MGYIKYSIVLIVVLLLDSCKINAQDESKPTDYIYGEWKYVKHFSWRATKFRSDEIDSIKSSTLYVEKNRIYYENINFIEPCFYSKIEFKKFFNKNGEPRYPEDLRLLVKYTKDQLSVINRIELDCEYNCLGFLYLKQDTLINYCGGLTFFMIKIDTIQDMPSNIKNAENLH